MSGMNLDSSRFVAQQSGMHHIRAIKKTFFFLLFRRKKSSCPLWLSVRQDYFFAQQKNKAFFSYKIHKQSSLPDTFFFKSDIFLKGATSVYL